DNLIIGTTTETSLGDNADVSTAGSLYTDGANVELDANDSIMIDGVIDTRKYATYLTAPVAGLLTAAHPSTGDSGNITLNAPIITISSTGALYADATSGHTGGAVTLTANTSNDNPIGFASATTSITINGAITGASIAANATSDAKSVYAFDSSNNSPGDMATTSALQIGLDLSPLSLTPGYVQSQGSATVIVGGAGTLTASAGSTGNIQLTAHTTANSSDPMVGLSPGGSAIAAGVVVGMTDATAKVEIENGATVSGGGALTVAATNDATVAIKTMVVSGFLGLTGAPAVVTVVYGEAEVNSSALIDSGANVDFSGSGSSVNILARNDNSFSAAATSYARNGGAAGAAVAITDFNSSAVAHDGASIGTTSNKVGDVTILAQDETASNQTSASTTTGVSTLGDVFAGISVIGSAVGQGIEGEGATPPTAGIISTIFSQTAFGKSMQVGGTSMPSAAGSLALALGTQTAAASISADVNTDANGNPISRIVATPPSIYSNASVAIASDVTDTAVLTYASASVNSPAVGTTINPSVSTAVSAAVAYTDITHNSSAIVGPDTSINAVQISLQATASLPSPIENIDWNDFASGSNSVLSGLLSALDQLLQNKLVATTGTNSTSGSTGLSIAGSIDIANFNLNTTAWVGDGATLHASSSNSVGSWQTPDLTSLDPKSGLSSGAAQESFTGAVWIYAKSTIEAINGAGNAGLSGNASSGTAAVGASFAYVDDTVNTIAGVAQGATISAPGEVYVDALTVEHVVDFSPSNGSGSGLNVSGLVDLLFLNDDTSASISNAAYVSAGTVNLGADDDVGVYSIAGDITFGKSSSVGMAVAYIDMSSDTEGYIGDNSNVVSAAIDPTTLDSATPVGFTAGVDAGAVDVYAKTSGNSIVAALVAQAIDSTPSPTSPIPGQSASQRLLQLANSASTSTVSVAIAGASAITDSAVKTAAYVDGATIDLTGQSTALTVQATNDMLVADGSGGAAIVQPGATVESSAAISGAIAAESSSNSTLAYVESSTVTASGVSVEAQTGGMTAVVGIGLSVDTSTSSSSGSAAGSASLAQIDDRVAAYIDNSTVSASGGNAVVLAEQDTEVGIGGGAFFFGGSGGFGAAITYLTVTNPSAGPATDAHISNSTVSGYDIDVIADAPQIVYSGAAAGGASTKATIGASLIFNTLDGTTSADISNSGTSAVAITATDDLGVIASTDLSDLPLGANSVFSSSDSGASVEQSFFAGDGSSTAQQAGGALLSGSSAAIISVAGVIEATKGSSAGVAIIDNTVDEAHSASISGVAVVAPDAVIVAATDSTSITSVAVGLSVSGDGYGGEGASVTNTIEGGPSASVGAAGLSAATTIGVATAGHQVGSLTVDATNSSGITGLAITGAFSNNGSAGVAISTNDIETTASASIESASVRTTYDSSNSFATGDIVVESQSTGSILSVAVGVAVSASSFAADGSISTNMAKGNVQSSVDNSTLFATNNVGVLAANNNAVNAVAGAAGLGLNTAGIGLSVTTDEIGGGASGNTKATITSSTVDAEAGGQDTLEIVSGALLSDLAAGVAAAQTSSAPEDPSSSVTPDALPNLGQDVRLDHGLAVVAASVETSVVTAVTLGLSTGVAGAINVATTTMGGKTAATISGASLDTNLTAPDAVATIDVSASSVSFANNLALSVAGSVGTFAGAATAVTNVMNRTTNAAVSTTNVGPSAADAPGPITIEASGWEGSAGEAIGAAASATSGAAGSALTNIFSADTTASFDHGTVYSGGLSVTANGVDGLFAAVGVAAFGDTSAGVGAAVLVTKSDTTTSATVGDSDASSATTTLDLTGALNIGATSTTDADTFAVVGAVGGSGGFAAQFSGSFIANTTTAELYNTTATLTNSTAADNAVNVESQENDTIDAYAGSLGAGLTTGVGASVNLVMLSSADDAWINGDTVSTPGAVTVSADSTRSVSPFAVNAGLGGSVGLAGTVGVVLVGVGANSDQMSVLNSGASPSQSNSGTLGNAGAATGQDVTAETGGAVDGISAMISGGSVTASSVSIAATGEAAIFNIVGALGVGIETGAFGAAVGYTNLDQVITASASSGTIVTSSLNIDASGGDDGSGHAAHTMSVSGAGGFYAGVGASVADSDVNNTITASLTSTVNDGTQTYNGQTGTVASTNVGVTASDASTSLSDAYGAAVGIGAVGISSATAKRDSGVTAETDTGAVITAQAVTIQASESGATYALSIGGAGGVVSGDGADATATDDATIQATILDTSRIIGAGGLVTSTGKPVPGVTVEASDAPDAKAFTFGVSVGAAAIGESYSDADASSHVTANIAGTANLSQTYGLTVEATIDVAGSPASSFPASATVPGATTEFVAGETTAAAWSIAGTGAVIEAADATVATALSATQVTAQTGASFVLPGGDIKITALNNTNQFAQGDGVTLTDGLSIGAVVVMANSSSTTTASMGASTTGTIAVVDASGDVTTPGTGAVSLSASGTDTNNANAIAGAGGLYAGDGAGATTTDTSTVTASVGNNTSITAISFNIGAYHNDVFSETAETINASALGASASEADHTATSTVQVQIGDSTTGGVTLHASAAGLAPCLNDACDTAIDITAENDFTDFSSGAQGGAGGGINGAGAVSNIKLNLTGGGTSIEIGKLDLLTSGSDPISAGGGIAVIADSIIFITDQDSLTTGGYIDGAGVNSTLDGTISNSITIDPSAILTTFGSLNVATYTTATISADAYVSTYGVAGVGVADASINLTSNQTINVDAGTTQNPTGLNAYHDVNVGAGDYVGLGIDSSFGGATQALGYVRGLIAIPAADAVTTIASNASVDIGANADVLAGQNVGIAAYHGSPSVTADGAGHGYELGFIPVTDGGGDPSARTSSTVTIDGTVISGQFAQIALVVTSAGAIDETVGAEPILYSYNAAEAVGCTYGVTASCIFDPSTYLTLSNAGYVSATTTANPHPTMATITLGGVFAAGGDVQITADTLNGAGSVTANGSPSVTITNDQSISLIIANGVTIPNVPGGSANFNGTTNDFKPFVQNNASTSPGALTITLTNNGASSGGIAPDVVLDGPLDNPGGLIHIINAYGSLVYEEVLAFTSSGAPITTTVNGVTQQVVLGQGSTDQNEQILTVPKGALIANVPTPGGEFDAGESPANEYAGNALYPGTQELNQAAGGLGDSTTNGTGNLLLVAGGLGGGYSGANLAVMFVASSIYLNNLTGTEALNFNTAAAVNSSSPNINAYLYGSETGNAATNTDQLVLFGTCGVGLPGDCYNPPAIGFQTNGSYAYQPIYVPVALTETLTSASESTSGSANGQIIVGSLMQVSASVIDINGTIYAGPATNYNVTIPALVGEVINDGKVLRTSGASSASTAAYNDANALANANPSLSAAIWNLFWTASSNVSYSTNISALVNFAAGTPASELTVNYNNGSNQIVVSDNDATNTINAYSTGASIKLDGDIISTNTLGQIHINSGFGQVSISNDTSYGLVLPTINTGIAANTTALSSSIMIVDRLKDQQNGNSNGDTTTYIYTPSTSGGTTVEYQTSNGAQPFDSNDNLTGTILGTFGATATYNPVAGATYEYIQEAEVQRIITSSGENSWNFISGIPGDPWVYVKPGESGGNSVTSSANETSATQAVGTAILLSPNQPAYREVIFGNIIREGSQPSTDTAYNFGYQGYDYASHCEGTCANGGANYSQFFPADAFIRITSYEKADNQIGLNFTGNAIGAVDIASNGAVIFGGNVANVDGTTVVTAGGTVTEAAGVSVSGESIALNGSAVGSTGQHFQAQLTTGLGALVGGFSASASNGGVYVDLASGANGFAVNAVNGDVVVNAQGSLVASSSMGLSAAGNNVTLTSANGQIGSAATPLALQTAAGGVLNVSASLGIDLTQPSGDLLVGVIASTNGDVTINVPNGAIYDALSQTQASSLSPGQVSEIAQTLGLIGGTGGDAAAGAAAITSFQNSVVSDLASYAAFLAKGSVTTGALGTLDSASLALYAPFETSALVAAARANPNGNAQFTTATTNQIQSEAASLTSANGLFVLNPAALTALAPQAAAALGISNPSNTQIQAWANAQYQAYATTFAQAYGAGWQTAVAPLIATQAEANPALAGYQSLLASGAVSSGGVYTLNAGSLSIYSAQAAAADNVANPTNQQVQAYASSLYQSDVSTLSSVYGANWQTTAASTPTYAFSFTVAAGSALATSLTSGASWTTAQLVQAVDVSALQPASTIVGSSATANIVGNNVTLNIGGAIGSYNPTGVQITLQALESGTLSVPQQAALEVATTPGQITLLGTTASGGALVAGTSLTNLPQGATVTGLNIAETSPVFINARAAVKVTSGGSVYLEGTSGSSISLNQVVAQGAVDLQTPGGISVATSNGTTPLSATQILTTGDLDLVASTGSIGSSTLPVTFSIGGALANASAAGDSYLASSGANALIERDFAGGTASITTSSGYSILSDLSGVNVSATDIILGSGGAIGATNAPLAVLASDALSGSAAGAANISAPTVGGNAPNALTIAAFTAVGNITLESDSTLTIQTALNSTSGGVATTSAALVMDSGSKIQAAGLVTLDTSGDATLGAIVNPYNPAIAQNTVTVLAGGTIWSNADGLTVTTGTHGLLSLTALEGIGDAQSPLVIDAAPLLSADATGVGSSISISDEGALDASQIEAVSTVALSAASMNLGTVTSGGTQTIVGAGAVAFTTLTTNAGSGGDIDVTSQTGSIQGGSVLADGSASLTSATSNDGVTATATNGSVTLVAGSLTSPSTMASIDWMNVNAGTSLNATSGGSLTLASVSTGTTGAGGAQTIHGSGAVDVTTTLATAGAIGVQSDASTVTIGSATSGGTQTIEAYLGLDYTTLKTTTGDIDLTSDTASITGNATGDTLDAKGSFDLVAVTTISGTSLKAEAGSGLAKTAGAIDLGATNTTTTLGVTSTGGAITLGSATSGGTQTIAALGDIGFTTLTTTAGQGGDADVTTTAGSITGGSVLADGSASLASATSNDGVTVTATTGSVTLAAGSLLSPSALASIGWTNVNAGTSLTATSGGGLTLADVSTGTTGAGGNQTIHGSGAVDVTTTLATAGAIGVQSDASTVTVGSATSDGTQTIEAYLSLGYTTLKTTTGDIDLTSDTASITGQASGDTLDAKGSFDLVAMTTISGTSLKAETGSGSVTAGGAINLGTTNTTTLGVTSTGDGVTIGSATSGGTQTIGATGDIGFTTLTTTAGHGGDVDVISTAGSITGGSVYADGSAFLASATSNDGVTVTATTGSVTLAAGSLLSPSALASIGWTNVNAGTLLTATSGGGLTLTDVSTGTTGAGGTQTIHGSGAVDVTTTLATGGPIGVQSDASTVTVGSATSGGTQTIEAYLGLGYTTLTAMVGDIDLTSDMASITGNATGDTLDAKGSFDLVASTTISGTSLKAETGSGSVTAGGAINLGTTNTTTTLGVTSTGGAVTIGSATSGGTQTIVANNDLLFTTLTTTGVSGDAGSIDLTSTLGAVQGQPTGSSLIASNADVTISGARVQLDTVTANGKASIDALTTLAGTSLTTGGDASLVAGVSTNLTPTLPVSLSWTTVKAGTTFGAQAYGGTIATLGSVTSGGAQTIGATGDIGFTTLTTTAGHGGDVDVTSTAGSIAGGSVFADGSASLASATSNDGITVTATTGSVTLAAGSLLSPAGSASIGWTNVNAGMLLTATSGGGLTLAGVSTGTTGAGGAQTIHGSGAVDVTTTLATGGPIGVKSDASTVMVGSATSDGTQTIEAYLGLGYTTLKTTAGDIDLASDTASITGDASSDTLDAYGSFKLMAMTTISGASLKTETGSGLVNAGGAIALGSTNTATTLGVTSTGDGVTIGSAASGRTQTIEADKALNYTTLKTTAGDIDLTSDTASITGNATGDTLDADGSFILRAVTTISGTSLKAETGSGFASTGGAIDLGMTDTAMTLGVASTGDGVTLGSANSGGTQTIEAHEALHYTTLKTTAGDIDLTSDLASITGDASSDTLDAYGSFKLMATTTISGTSLKGETGSGLVNTGGVVALGSTNTATTLGVTSTGDAVAIGSATSGGTQTIEADKALAYTMLQTTAGDIDLTSDTASITGQASAPDTLDAKSSFTLAAATTISGTSLKAETGSGLVTTGGAIDLGTTNTATTLGVTSTGDGVTIGSATSGGTQTIGALGDIGFTTLTTTAGHGGDVDVTSTAGSIAGVTATANGSVDLAAYTDNKGTTVTATAGSVRLAAGSPSSPSGSASIDWTNVNAGTSLTATSGGGLTLANVSTGTTGAGGNQTIHGSGAVNVTTTLAASGAIGVQSDASTVTLGSATSDGTQTIEAYLGLGYTTLKTTAGDIDLTSDRASITGAASGDTLDAKGSFTLAAATTVSGTSLKAETGNGLVNTGGAIVLDSTNTATTLGVTSTGDAVTIGSATSGGTQAIEAYLGLGYTTLKTTAGDIDLTSDTASITGDASSDTLDAYGSFKLMATTTISGTSLKAETDSGLINTGGAIALGSTNTATTFGVTSTGNRVTIGSATSGGTQTIEADKALVYTTLKTTAGDIDLTSNTASIVGQAGGDTLDAEGSFILNAATTISGTSLKAETGSGSVTAGGAINLGTTNAATMLGVTSTGDAVTIGSATSGGTQTIEAYLGLGYTTLKTTAGDIDLTSDTASITGNATGDTLDAKGSFDLAAVTAISGTSLKAEMGSGLVKTAGALSLGTTDTTATLGVTSTGDGVTIGSATSGGTQTIGALRDIGFTTLTTTAGHGGDVDVTSTAGSITGGSVFADGSASLASATSNDGVTVTATTGSVTLAAGNLLSPSGSDSIGWTNVNAGMSLTATSGGGLTLADVSTGTTGAGGNQTIHGSGAVAVTTTLATAGAIGVQSDASTVTIGSATSGGTQTIEAYLGLGYTTLTATVGDINLTSDMASITGNATGDTLDAKGSFDLVASTTISGTSLKAETGSG
ncbi:hypothetical protein, partial [Methylocapsa sp. S129]|uniref:hypothetical protein n=1 Tax=Methylocapsa sp. S129 TaxID=1641869 RepID=UPI001AEDCCBE